MASVVEPSSGSRHSPMKLHFMQFAAGGCAGRVPFLTYFKGFRINLQMLLNSLLKIQDQYRYNRFVLMVLMCILYINVFRIYLLPLILVCYIFCDGSKFNLFFVTL